MGTSVLRQTIDILLKDRNLYASNKLKFFDAFNFPNEVHFDTIRKELPYNFYRELLGFWITAEGNKATVLALRKICVKNRFKLTADNLKDTFENLDVPLGPISDPVRKSTVLGPEADVSDNKYSTKHVISAVAVGIVGVVMAVVVTASNGSPSSLIYPDPEPVIEVYSTIHAIAFTVGIVAVVMAIVGWWLNKDDKNVDLHGHRIDAMENNNHQNTDKNKVGKS